MAGLETVMYIQFFLLLIFKNVANVQSITIVNYTTVSNTKFANGSMKIFNDYKSSSRMNLTLNLNSVLLRAILHIKVNTPLNSKDVNYERNFLTAAIDINKTLKGNQGNYVHKIIIDMMKDSIVNHGNFSLKFPLKPGTFLFENFSFNDKLIPFPANNKGYVEVRVAGKVGGLKSSVTVISFKVFGRIKNY
jgi:Protein of unknown function (DUF1091)